jgi:glycerol-3-phosphate O-acyltransferase / dihydroxyacetone phosphate acyltransferase
MLRLLSRSALRWFYRSIEVTGAEHVPSSGAVILAATHSNAMVDALVVGTTLSRRVQLTAKATLLEHPVTRWLVRSLGIVPLRRSSDERQGPDSSPERNASAFAIAVDTLRGGGAILIFPEGKSHSEPSLAELRTGCARMALQARAAGVAPLSIVPVAIVFERKDRPRSRAAIRYGAALPVTVDSGPAPSAVAELTTQLDAALRSLTLNVETHRESDRILEVSRVIAAVVHRVGPLERPEPSLQGTIDVATRVDRARRASSRLPAATLDHVDAFLARLDAFRHSLDARGVPLTELWVEPGTRPALSFAAREAVIFLLAGPAAVWGRLNHWLPLRIATWAGRVSARNLDEPAMRTLIVGIGIVLAFYALIAVVVYRAFGGIAAVAYLLSLPPSATLSFWLTERLQVLRRRVRTFMTFRRHPELQRALIAEAAALRAEAERLERELI